MSRDSEYFLDMLEAARLAMSYVAQKTREEFEADVQCQDAVIRRLEVIGEAARRISEQTRSALPHLPWNAIIGMRSVMIHEYDDVDLSVVWDTVQNHLPGLIRLIQPLVQPEEGA